MHAVDESTSLPRHYALPRSQSFVVCTEIHCPTPRLLLFCIFVFFRYFSCLLTFKTYHDNRLSHFCLSTIYEFYYLMLFLLLQLNQRFTGFQNSVTRKLSSMLKLCDHFEIPLSILPSLQYMYLVRYCEANCCARLVHSRHLLKILAHYCDILFARKNIFQMATLKTGGRVQHPRKSRFCVFATFRVKLTLSVDVYKTLCYCRKSAVHLNTWRLFWI